MTRSNWLLVLVALIVALAGCDKKAETAQTGKKDVDSAPEIPVRKILVVNTEIDDKIGKSYKTIVGVLIALQPRVKVDIVHYSKVDHLFVAAYKPEAVVLGPQGTPWWEYDQEKLEATRDAVRRYEGPVLGICGGHQFLSTTYGGEVGPMQCVEGHKGYQGCVKEEGFTVVEKKVDDPLLAGLPGQLTLTENHYECVKRMPAGFEVLAGTEMCPVQAIRMTGRPVYGVQFHPERYDDANQHGRVIMSNWLKITGLL